MPCVGSWCVGIAAEQVQAALSTIRLATCGSIACCLASLQQLKGPVLHGDCV